MLQGFLFFRRRRRRVLRPEGLVWFWDCVSAAPPRLSWASLSGWFSGGGSAARRRRWRSGRWSTGLTDSPIRSLLPPPVASRQQTSSAPVGLEMFIKEYSPEPPVGKELRKLQWSASPIIQNREWRNSWPRYPARVVSVTGTWCRSGDGAGEERS